MNAPEDQSQILQSLVSRIFRIEDVTLGGNQQPYIVRYRGFLVGEDSSAAYDQLAAWLSPYAITTLISQGWGAPGDYPCPWQAETGALRIPGLTWRFLLQP